MPNQIIGRTIVSLAFVLFPFSHAQAATLNLSDTPLFLTQATPPLTMLVVGKDHKLYYEAYNDASDVDGDGIPDVGFKPSIDYYGYFDVNKCYNYSGGLFSPASLANNKKCAGNWSGNFLNYLTMSRIDTMRKVLYGGYRMSDTATETILERSHIPQDAHSWGKEYTNIAVDGYDISEYTPFGVPSNSKRHLFANTTLLNGSGEPFLRVSLNQSYRIWEWVSIERPVAGNRVLHGSNGPKISSSITDYIVRVRVCDANLLEPNCQRYPSGNYKPIGLLQTFGESDKIKFGLLTGSYSKNLSGGVLRKNIESINNEIDSNSGQFTALVGIIKTLDRFKVIGFGGNYEHNSNCGFIFQRDMLEGECRLWGNPIAEMMYESVRYFAGKSSPTAAYTYSGGDDDALGLPQPAWKDPYGNNANPRCAKPNMLVISDIYPSYDTDQVAGSAFNSYTGDLSPSLDAASLGQTIWNNEIGGNQSIFIGQVANLTDGAPTPKVASSFGNIRGLAPEEPNKQGGYYAASVAYYSRLNDVSNVDDEQFIHTFTVGLNTPLPQIIIPVNNQSITLVPFAKSVGTQPNNCAGGIDADEGSFQPTNTIVDFYVESLTPTTGTFRINFEDAQQGADHDMDAIVKYNYVVNPDNTVTITLNSSYAAGCVIQHMGYVISGSTADGIYLEVRDTDTNSDVDYFLDTPPGEQPGGNWNDNVDLPLTATRTFTPGVNTSSVFLQNPLWYAAKWGGFTDTNDNKLPDLQSEWDADNDGNPDNYFLVSNATLLERQLETALENILNRSSSAAAAATNSGALNNNSRVYQATFNSKTWTGELFSYALDPTNGAVKIDGPGPKGSLWEAGSVVDNQNFNTGRQILTYKPSTAKGIAFRWPNDPTNPLNNELDLGQVALLNLNPDSGIPDTLGEQRLNYIRGSKAAPPSGAFRDRTGILGDIIHSTPLYVGPPQSNYSNFWPDGDPENTVLYSDYRITQKNRDPILYFGANDGLFHAVSAADGRETFAYVPSKVFNNLSKLTSVNYAHKYFVDGAPSFADVFYSGAWHTSLVGSLGKGGQSVFALDVTDLNNTSEGNASNRVLWEFSDSDDVDLGYTYGQPAIGRMHNGKWAAIFGNGYNNTENDGNTSTTGNGVLYIVDIETGNLIRKLDTQVGMVEDPLNQGRPNGLATAALVDPDADNVIDYIYVGDLFGNLWKIDVRDSNDTKWDFAFKSGNKPGPLFTAVDANGNHQAITSQPEVGKDKDTIGGFSIYFGTGKYMEGSDKSDLAVQTFYSLDDDHSGSIAGRIELLQQSIESELTVTSGSGSAQTFRVTSANLKSNSDSGWYIDLVQPPNAVAQGERVVSRPFLRNGKIIFTTLIPAEDVCEFGGSSWLMEMDAQHGSRLAYSPFDLNKDGSFTTADYVTATDSNGNPVTVPVSGLKSEVGIINEPAIIAGDKVEYKYTPGSSGNLQTITENPAPSILGRQSWRQLR